MNKIEIVELVKKFGKTVAVDIPSLNIRQGELVGLAGNNGAGKTTLLRLLLDLLKADRGYATINGVDVSRSEDWKQTTGSFIDAGFLIDFLLPEEFFRFIGEVYHLTAAEVDSRLAQFEKFMNGEILNKNKFIRYHSTGNRQKIGIIGAMIIQPDILMLDEPFNFLDPSSQIEIKRLMRQLNTENNTTILLSSHNLAHLADFSTRIIVLEKGTIVKDLPNTNTETVMNELEKYFLYSL